MAFEIESLRVRIGLQDTDNSRDDELNNAIAVAIKLAENYCHRWFLLNDYVESFTHAHGYSLSLKAYPIVSITTVLDQGNHVDKRKGLIKFDGHLHEHELTIEYRGGYDPASLTFPPDLEYAILSVFDAVFATQGGSSGANVSGIRTAKIGSLSITYDNAGESESGATLIPDFALSILSSYRRELA